MTRGVPAGGAVGSLAPADEPTVLCPLLPPMLPVVDVVPVEPVPTVPVTGAGTPALPVPVPRLGATVVFPGPLPPGIPAPEGGVWAGAPGWPGAEEVAVPGAEPPVLAPALPPLAPPPLDPPLPPPPLPWAKAIVEAAARNRAVSSEIRTGMGRLLTSGRHISTTPGEASFRLIWLRGQFTQRSNWAPPPHSSNCCLAACSIFAASNRSATASLVRVPGKTT